MLRRLSLLAGLATAIVANEAAAQPSAQGAASVRARVFNPFAPFSFSRLTVNPFGLPQLGKLPLARQTSSASLQTPAEASVPATAADEGFQETTPTAALAVRPPYRPPVRSPYRPPPRPPF
jgi:hypothetical protein